MSGFKQTGLVISEKATPVDPTNTGDITVVSRDGKLYKYDGVTEVELAEGDLSNYTLLSTTAEISGSLQTQIDAIPVAFQIACGDETSACITGSNIVTFRAPYAFTLTGVRASLTTAQASGNTFTVDIKQGGTSVLSTLLTIDNTEKTSVTAATAPVISTSSITDDAEITISITQIGNGTAKGLKVTLVGNIP